MWSDGIIRDVKVRWFLELNNRSTPPVPDLVHHSDHGGYSWRVALQQSLPPLRQPTGILNQNCSCEKTIFLACVSGFGLAASLTHLAIVEAVNVKLSTTDQFGQLGWGPVKSLKLSNEYRRFFPSRETPKARRYSGGSQFVFPSRSWGALWIAVTWHHISRRSWRIVTLVRIF